MNKKIIIIITLLLILASFITFNVIIDKKYDEAIYKSKLYKEKEEEAIFNDNKYEGKGLKEVDSSNKKNSELTEIEEKNKEKKNNYDQNIESDLEFIDENEFDETDDSFAEIVTEDYGTMEIDPTDSISFYNQIYNNEKTINYIRTDEQNEVTAEIVFLNFIITDDKMDSYYLFDVYFNTHSYSISEEDLDKKISLVSSEDVKISENIIWEPQGFADGHHVSGRIYIPKKINENKVISENTEYVKLIMKNTAGADNRIFEWNNEEVEFTLITN